MNPPSSRHAIELPPAPRPPAANLAPPLTPDPDLHCPRCHAVLTDPQGIGMCPRCGYCRSLHAEGVAVLAATGPANRPTLQGLGQALHVAPATFLAILLAFLAVIPLAYLADQRLPPGSRERALWSAGNLLCGSLLVIAGQAWAITLLKEMKEQVRWIDMFSPLQLWGLTLRRLPATAWPVGLGGSGFLAALTALVWVGGLSYWLSLYPTDENDGPEGRVVAGRHRESKEGTELARVARTLGLRQQERNDGSPERRPESPIAAGEVPFGRAQVKSVAQSSAKITDSRPVARCVIVGFVPASGGREPGLVLARLREGQLVFAGFVRKGLSPDLLDRLSKLSRARPLMDGIKIDAVWVRPELFCEVHQSGSNEKGELVDPDLKGLIED